MYGHAVCVYDNEYSLQPQEELCSFELDGDRRETELVICLFCSLASEDK